MHLPGFDIFCRVVDNYGDIGVCWRLAKQLAQHSEVGPVRLWVDDLASFHQIEKCVRPTAAQQVARGVQIHHWTQTLPDVRPLEVVVEAFACDLPQMFLDRMTDNLWINLEYLSAEDWVESCHALPSIQPNGLNKFFFFPGFTPRTGGLLREPDLLDSQATWTALPESRRALLDKIGMPDHVQGLLLKGWRQAFVFCYNDAPAQALANALGHPGQPTLAIVPRGVLPELSQLQNESFQVFESPFVDQDEFDHLLWSSDLNVVRGEDSLVRAIWAGKPFLWHIYRQKEDAHMAKLDAWLERTHLSAEFRQTIRAFNQTDESAAIASLQEAVEPRAWEQWRMECLAFRQAMTDQTSLVTRLLAFRAEKAGSG